jgi:ElaB/YqjD/DUF883 family membrane-anchored ribosome-binding protein
MESTSAYNEEKEPEEIRAQIQQTRANISETVNILQERLAPERLKEQAQDMAEQFKEQAQDKIRDATIGRIEKMADNVNRQTKRASYSIVETIKQNPVPAALAGLGIGWLLVEGFKSSSEDRYYEGNGGRYQTRYYEPRGQYQSQGGIGETFSSAQEKVGEFASQTREQVEELGSQAREKVGHISEQVQDQASQTLDQVSQLGSQAREKAEQLGSQAREKAEQLGSQAREKAEIIGNQVQEQAQWAKSQFWQTMEENPLMVGAAALALGVVVGLSIPETRYENRLMGETRDNLMDKAQEKAQAVTQDTMQKVQRVAEEAQRVVKEEAENQDLIKPERESFRTTI